MTSPLRRMTTRVGPGRTENRVLLSALGTPMPKHWAQVSCSIERSTMSSALSMRGVLSLRPWPMGRRWGSMPRVTVAR